jgi:hypothetical protein
MGGNDQLYGGSGNDTLFGGTGNDIYYVNASGDQVVEYTGEGNDLVISTVTYELAGNAGNVERLYLRGAAAVDGKGNTLGNTLIGNSAANRLEGLAGRDTLNGGNGDDVVSGGRDGDLLIGGAGADSFRFAGCYASEAGFDTVRDFVHGTDKVQIEHYYYGGIESQGGPIAAIEFTKGTAATTANQNLIYNQDTGVLYYDADGTGAQAKIAIALFEGKPVLDASDIVMI